MNTEFWNRLNLLMEASELVIDRPKGSQHPKYPEVVYPLDYGYLNNNSGGDGNEIVVWKGSMEIKVLIAIACTVDILKKDTEIKLIVGCSDREIEIIKQFHQNKYMSAIVIKNNQ